MHTQLPNEAAVPFIFGGKATFTLQSNKTGDHFTYKAQKAKDGNAVFLSVMTGRDNENDYTYAGLLTDKGVVKTKKSKIGSDALSVRALNWTLSMLAEGKDPGVTIWHEGRCCKCGRKLTNPESIQTGIGPECAKKGTLL